MLIDAYLDAASKSSHKMHAKSAHTWHRIAICSSHQRSPIQLICDIKPAMWDKGEISYDLPSRCSLLLWAEIERAGYSHTTVLQNKDVLHIQQQRGYDTIFAFISGDSAIAIDREYPRGIPIRRMRT